MNTRKDIQGNGNNQKVMEMFDSIAYRYDFLNHFLSFGIDRYWRRIAIRAISELIHNPSGILDVATGTADLAIAAMKINPVHVTGIDVSKKMLEAGREKIRRLSLQEKISLIEGDSQKIEFGNETFDVVMVAFGVRNFSDPLSGLSEMNRVLRKGGVIMVLEFSRPSGTPFKQLYQFYFLKILPLTGRLFSKNQYAYTYLPESVMKFPDNEQFVALLGMAGFRSVKQKRLTGGIASIYTGLKF